MSCSRRTPATGIIKFNTPTKLSGEAAGVISGATVGDGSTDGVGEGIGERTSVGLGDGLMTFAADGLETACGGVPCRVNSPPRRLCKTQTTTTVMHTNNVATASQSR